MLNITRHQIMEGLRDAKFLFLVAIVFITFVINGFVFSHRYALDREDFEDNLRSTVNMLASQAENLQEISNYPQMMMMPPSALSFIHDGGEERLPNVMQVNAFFYGNLQYINRGNEMMASLPPLDWSFIIGSLMTLASLLISYGAICGEKRDGTLKLLLSYPVSRRALFFGKFLGLLTVSLIVLGLGLFIDFAIIVLLGEIPLGVELALPLAWIILLAVLLMAFTILVGMTASALTSRPAVSLVILLIFWVVTVAAVPGVSRLLAEQTIPVRSNYEVDKEIERALEDVDSKHPKKAWNYNEDKPFAEHVPLRRDWVTDRVATQQRLHDEALEARFRQADSVRDFAAISPVGLFNASCETVCNTGVSGVRSLWVNARRFQAQMNSFTVEQDKRDPGTPHLVYSFGTRSDLGTFSTKPVELSSLPRMQVLWSAGGLPREETTPLAAVAMLALLTALVAGIAFIAVSRYDPR